MCKKLAYGIVTLAALFALACASNPFTAATVAVYILVALWIYFLLDLFLD